MRGEIVSLPFTAEKIIIAVIIAIVVAVSLLPLLLEHNKAYIADLSHSRCLP